MKMNVGSMVKTELLRALVVSVYTCKRAGDSQLFCILILRVRFPKGCRRARGYTSKRLCSPPPSPGYVLHLMSRVNIKVPSESRGDQFINKLLINNQ